MCRSVGKDRRISLPRFDGKLLCGWRHGDAYDLTMTNIKFQGILARCVAKRGCAKSLLMETEKAIKTPLSSHAVFELDTYAFDVQYLMVITLIISCQLLFREHRI